MGFIYRLYIYSIWRSTLTGGTCPNDFSDPIDQDICTQCALTWKIVVTEWRSVIAVSLNVGGGIRLIKPAKLYMCTQTHYKHDKDGRMAPGVRGQGSVPLSHSTRGTSLRELDYTHICQPSGAPGRLDRVFAAHAGSRGFDSHRRHQTERFFRSNRPGYPHPACSEQENSGVRVAVGYCSVTERRRWRPPYQTGKTVHMHENYKHDGDGRTALGVLGHDSVPLSHSGNIVIRTGLHTHTRPP